MGLIDLLPVPFTWDNALTYTGIFLGLATTYIVIAAIYNLYFHPLKNYPGPLLHRASSIPYALGIIGGRFPVRLIGLHDKYGPVVRIAPNHLNYTDAQAWKDIYGHRSGAHHSAPENPKATVIYRAIDAPVDIITSERDEHARLRRALANGFSERSLRLQEPTVRHYVDLLIQRLHENGHGGSTPLNMVQWYNWTTFDIIGDLVFAESFGCLEKQQYHPFVYLITEGLGALRWLLALSYIGLRWITQLMAKTSMTMFAEIREGMGQKLKKRLAVKGDRDDLFEGIMKKREEWGMSMEKLEANASLLVVAGSETTATLLSGVTYHLLKNPHVLEKLVKEIRTSFNNADEITFTSVGHLPYLLATLNEGLRRYPPVTSNLPRQVHEGGDIIAGQYVPANSVVEVQQYTINHSTRNWKDPFTFRPERFLHKFDPEGNRYPEDLAKEGDDHDNVEAMQAFSLGPRNCVGRNLAYAEMRVILARVLFEFDLSLDERSRDWTAKQKMVTVWAKTPLWVRLTPVKR